ncbi:MAG: hypothetical protein RL648_138, partial [Verrucomicrobiota bacterium]
MATRPAFSGWSWGVIKTEEGARCNGGRQGMGPDLLQGERRSNRSSSLGSLCLPPLIWSMAEHRIPCAGRVGFPFFGRLILDVLNRTETAMTQAHCLKAA